MSILEHEDTRIFERRNGQNELMACAVINKNTILLLCSQSVGDTIDGVLYRWATPDDISEICNCCSCVSRYHEKSI